MYTLAGITYNLGERYEVLGLMAVFIKALDKKTNELVIQVAIKKLHTVQDIVDAKRILREVRILRTLRNFNILELKDIIFNPLEEGFGEIYLVTNLMQVDLHFLIKSKEALTDGHIQYILYQLLLALLYLHSANVVHRDIKPSNILINEECDVQLSDFGLARSYDLNEQKNLTEYVVTRHYRAPEIMLSSCEYGKAVDMWSLGCTMAELATGNVLFPGKNYVQQIKLIFQTLGKPADLSFVTNTNAKKFVESLTEKPSASLKQKVNYPNENFMDLLSRMLEIDPSKRITAKEALAHPYLKDLKEAAYEREFEGTADFKFEKDPHTKIESIKESIIDEINYYKTRNKQKPFDPAVIIKRVSGSSKPDPKFTKLDEKQAKLAQEKGKISEVCSIN